MTYKRIILLTLVWILVVAFSSSMFAEGFSASFSAEASTDGGASMEADSSANVDAAASGTASVNGTAKTGGILSRTKAGLRMIAGIQGASDMMSQTRFKPGIGVGIESNFLELSGGMIDIGAGIDFLTLGHGATYEYENDLGDKITGEFFANYLSIPIILKVRYAGLKTPLGNMAIGLALGFENNILNQRESRYGFRFEDRRDVFYKFYDQTKLSPSKVRGFKPYTPGFQIGLTYAWRFMPKFELGFDFKIRTDLAPAIEANDDTWIPLALDQSLDQEDRVNIDDLPEFKSLGFSFQLSVSTVLGK